MLHHSRAHDQRLAKVESVRYGDLIQFEPIETVVQLKHADALDAARALVKSYVISDEMAERVERVVIPQLQFEQPADNKGLLVVGNYGTGKSHLMSVISAVAEHAELAPLVQSATVAAAAVAIAGKFKVVRTELGATEMGFRDFVTSQLEMALARWGVDYTFPAMDRIPNHKGAFEQMMATFAERYPDQGILFVVDEFLDYLRARKDQPLIQDLGFLRELGEICKDSRFRFMAGVQEAIFDSSRFSFVSSELNRVKARFEQVFIARRDVKYVVAQRLLRKNAAQLSRIREHLTPFAAYYGSMNERMDEFVQLFPIHPEYIDTFEQITLAEKREVLKTLSRTMQAYLQREVPEDQPGLIAYDSYWEVLRQDAGFRAIPAIREVIDVSQVLENRVQQNANRHYKAMAMRIVHGLSVDRLTTGDIAKPIGVTPEELRDGLCLYDPLIAGMGGEPEADLLGQVETVLREILKTVNGQYITYNRDNRQYYLDLAKTVDYDQLVEQRAATLDETALDRYYFNALAQVLERTDQTYRTGYQIWQYELDWRDRKTTRLGYLFFGAPNERSTAQPPRDFYLYFLQPFQPPSFQDGKHADEVFFRLKRPDEVFSDALRRYAAALDLAATSSGEAKATYGSKASQALKALVNWLQEHMTHAFDVTHQGTTRPLAQWAKGVAGGNANVRDLVNSIGAGCLAAHFQEQAPEYPRFTVQITATNRAQAAGDALRWIRGALKPQLGAAVLDALGLLDGSALRPERESSRYAGYILQLLAGKPQGHVLNRGDILERVGQDVEFMAPKLYRLEPELVVVLLAALVANGNLVLAIAGQRFDAGNLDVLTSTPLAQLLEFKHVERPREWNLPALKALFELLGLPAGQAQQITQGDGSPVQALQAAATQNTAGVVMAQQHLQAGFALWGRALLDEAELTTLRTRLEGAKGFLEGLQPYSTPAKLKNLKYDVPEIQAQGLNLGALQQLKDIQALLNDVQPGAGYLMQAETAMPEQDPWVNEQLKKTRQVVLAGAANPALRTTPAFRQGATGELQALRRSYVLAYMNLHTKARLDANDDKRKVKLLQDPRLKTLQALRGIELMPGGELEGVQNALAGLRSCWMLTEQDLQTAAICPHCSFKPAAEPVAVPARSRLQQLDNSLDAMLATWTETLRTNLDDPITRASMDLLSAEQRTTVAVFIAGGPLPQPVGTELVQTFQQVLRGLSRVELTRDGLAAALLEGGMPATSKVLEARFTGYLNKAMGGKDPNSVRIVIE